MECVAPFDLGPLKGFKTASVLIVSDSLVKEGEKELVPAERPEPYVRNGARAVLRALSLS